jgi:hypothetical protein
MSRETFRGRSPSRPGPPRYLRAEPGPGGRRRSAGSATLAPEDILLTKLQIFEVNEKDLIDSVALLLSHPVTSGGAPGISTSRLAKVAGADWGWHTTLSDNLAKVAQWLPTADLADADAEIVSKRLARSATPWRRHPSRSNGGRDARLSPDGRTLFVDESKIGAVGAFAVRGGHLTELNSSPTALPAGATPAGLAVS